MLIAKWLFVFVCVQTRASPCERQHLWLFRYAPDWLLFFACSSAGLFTTSRWGPLQKQNTRPLFTRQQKTLHTLTVDLQSHTGSTRNQIHTVLHWLLSDQLAHGRCFSPTAYSSVHPPPIVVCVGLLFLACALAPRAFISLQYILSSCHC